MQCTTLAPSKAMRLNLTHLWTEMNHSSLILAKVRSPRPLPVSCCKPCKPVSACISATANACPHVHAASFYSQERFLLYCNGGIHNCNVPWRSVLMHSLTQPLYMPRPFGACLQQHYSRNHDDSTDTAVLQQAKHSVSHV